LCEIVHFVIVKFSEIGNTVVEDGNHKASWTFDAPTTFLFTSTEQRIKLYLGSSPIFLIIKNGNIFDRCARNTSQSHVDKECLMTSNEYVG
jgi:hypothetical protein